LSKAINHMKFKFQSILITLVLLPCLTISNKSLANPVNIDKLGLTKNLIISENDISTEIPNPKNNDPTLPEQDTKQVQESLSQSTNDPTASLKALVIGDWYTPSLHGLNGKDFNSVVIRPVIPFKLGNLNNIFRATFPIVTNTPGPVTGLADSTIFDLVVFNEPWGRWGIGPVILIPTGGGLLGSEKWALGPAIGFTAKADRLLWGIFNQNVFSFAGNSKRPDANLSILQPLVNYTITGGWSIGTSEMAITYDWESGKWVSLPLGIKLTKLVMLGKFPTQLGLQYEYNFAKDPIGGPEHTIRFTLSLVFP
jgi:hypothetical protein